jgi:hypothetical protein
MHDSIEDRQTVYQTYRTDALRTLTLLDTFQKWIGSPMTGLTRKKKSWTARRSEITNNEPDTPDETQGLVDNPTYLDNDDRWHDTVEHLDSGIRDIISLERYVLHSILIFSRSGLCMPVSWAVEPDTWVSTPAMPCPFPGTKSLGIIRRVNTDYHHGDCPVGSFWCGVQMKTGDHNIRLWGASGVGTL